MPAFTDGIAQPTRAPSFFMGYFAIPVADELLNAAPCLGGLFLVQHGTQDYDKFVMKQKALLFFKALNVGRGTV
jgi:hypothetical protein